MPTPAMTTRLDAVNTILTASGEQPVTALNNSTADVANATSLLDEVSREVQSLGWNFNTDIDVPLTPDNSGNIDLPSNVLACDVDPKLYWNIDPVQRGTRFYDRRNRTYAFTQALKAKVTYLLPFDELPEQARRYIAMKAARVFHARFVSSETIFRFTSQEEAEARAALIKAHLASSDVNLFRSNPNFYRTHRRA